MLELTSRTFVKHYPLLILIGTDAFNSIYNILQTAGSTHIMVCRVIQIDSYVVFDYVQRHLYSYTTSIILDPCRNTIILKVTVLKRWITKLFDTKKEGQH